MNIRSACKQRPLHACPAPRCAAGPAHHPPALWRHADGHHALQSAPPKAPHRDSKGARKSHPEMYIFPSLWARAISFSATPGNLFSRQLRPTSTWKASGGRGHQGRCGPRPERSLGMVRSQLSGRALEGSHCLRSLSRFPGVKALTPNTSLKTI